MKPLRTGNLINRIDEAISKHLLPTTVALVALSLVLSITITTIRIKEYSGYKLCVSSPDCFTLFGTLISPQVEILKAGAAASSLIILISGAYLAIRSYLTASQVGMLGNAIAHITFFERFVFSELAKRQRLNPRHVDAYAIYEIMFPRSHQNQRFADDGFTNAVDGIFEVIKESSKRYTSRRNEFRFDDHRRRLIESLSTIHITMEPSARIDFLETEDEAIDFVVMLCRIFAQPGYAAIPPKRSYR